MNSHAPAADSPDLFWEQIGQAAFDREADVEQRLLEPLLRALGYQSTDIRAKPAVRFQTGRAGRSHEADYIVYQGPINDRTTSLIVVEAKPPRDALGDALKQAESYAFNVRAPFLILANGRSLEIWQLQPTKESIKVLSCNISELNSHRGRIEALVGRDAAIAHCRALHLKELPSATGMFAPYIVSELNRLSGREGIERDVQCPDGTTIRSLDFLNLPAGALIAAASGFGKTTLFDDLHRQALGIRVADDNAPLPIQIQLADAASQSQKVTAYGRDRIKARWSGLGPSEFNDMMRDQGALFLCDQFDRLKQDDRARVAAELKTALRDYPKCKAVVFDRVASGTLLGLSNYSLPELTSKQQYELAEQLLGKSISYSFYSMPETLKRLAFHPLLLTLILNHYGAHKRYPHKLSDLFEGWIAKLLDAPSQAPSHLARLRQALVALAQATASGPISMADAMHCIANLGLVETVIDELASLGAVTADFLVELRHEALADYLRVQALMVGDEQGVVKRIESVDIQQGSLFPAFMIERATAAGAQRACWQRLSRHRLSDYGEVLRYRGDLTSHYAALSGDEASKLFCQEFFDGFIEPLHGFFPQLQDMMCQSITGNPDVNLGLVGQLVDNREGFIFDIREREKERPEIELAIPRQNVNYQSLKRGHIRLDGGRLLGFARLRKEIENLVERRWLHGGPLFANERLVGRVRYLIDAYEFPLHGCAELDAIAQVLDPHRGLFAGDRFSGRDSIGFWIDEMIGDIETLRSAGATMVDFWWTKWPELDFGNEEAAKELMNELWRRVQLIYAEIVERSFASITDELAFYRAMPVRYSITLIKHDQRPNYWAYSWLPVRTWEEAGADVELADAAPSVWADGDYDEIKATFSKLKRDGIKSVTRGMGTMPTFDGTQSYKQFDGETAAMKLVMEWVRADLGRLLDRAPQHDPGLMSGF